MIDLPYIVIWRGSIESLVRCLMLKYLNMKIERVEWLLENEIGMMSPEAIRQRVRCVIYPDGNLERYYCDDKLLFEVELIPKDLKWVFRTPNNRIHKDAETAPHL